MYLKELGKILAGAILGAASGLMISYGAFGEKISQLEKDVTVLEKISENQNNNQEQISVLTERISNMLKTQERLQQELRDNQERTQEDLDRIIDILINQQ